METVSTKWNFSNYNDSTEFAKLPSIGSSGTNIVSILYGDVSEMLAMLFSLLISIQDEISSASHLIEVVHRLSVNLR